MDDVTVTQEDREAAATFYAARMWGRGKKAELIDILKREADGEVDPLVLLFARHRLTALEQAGRLGSAEAPDAVERVRTAIEAVPYPYIAPEWDEETATERVVSLREFYQGTWQGGHADDLFQRVAEAAVAAMPGERVAIARYVRSKAPPVIMGGPGCEVEKRVNSERRLLSEIADAIERGEHLTKEKCNG